MAFPRINKGQKVKGKGPLPNMEWEDNGFFFSPVQAEGLFG